MPELPAVEYSRRLLEANILNKTVETIRIVNDPIVFERVEPDNITTELANRTILDARRYGKYLWLVLDQGRYLLMHFGMTGFVEIQGVDRLHYRSAPEGDKPHETSASAEWPPRFWKLELTTCDGSKFAFGDARRLGRIKILKENPLTVPPVSKLGFDPILRMPEFDGSFVDLTKKRATPLKSLLLDQSYAAGVGNWMADDIMLHAQLHPETRTCNLTDDEAERLHNAIRFISETAVAASSDGSKFPSDWLFHYRWPSDRRKQARPEINGLKIEFITVGGRTTALIPAIQKKTRSVVSSKQAGPNRPKRKKG